MDMTRRQLYDELTGALIGLARAMEADTLRTDDTAAIVIEGLGMIAPEADIAEDKLRAMISRVRAEKDILAPGCSTCKAPCGRTADFDMKELGFFGDEVKELKQDILQMLGHAAYCAQQSGKYTDEDLNELLWLGLFKVGYEIGADELRQVIEAWGAKLP